MKKLLFNTHGSCRNNWRVKLSKNNEALIYVSDIETTGLLHHLIEQGKEAKMHNFCAMNLEGKKMYLLHSNTEEERTSIQRFLDRGVILVMHNGICYDKHALIHFGYDVSKVTFVDTLALSFYLDLYRPKHGLEGYGIESGVPKPVVEDWQILSQRDYDHRVKEDVKIQLYTYRKLKSRFEELYGEMTDYEFCTHKVVRYLNFKMTQLAEQQNTRFKIDVPKARNLLEELEHRLKEKVTQLESVMPKVVKYKKNVRPKKPYKKDGSLSAIGERWKELTEENGYDFDYLGEIKTISGYNEPNAQSPQQIKDWLFSLGWKPKTFKYDKDSEGNERSIPQIYIPDSGGQICYSIEELSEEVPDVQELTGMGVLKHRAGVVKGFLDSLIFDNYIEASASAFTNTLRLKHRKPAVNLPSVRVDWGMECRSCMVARDGKVLGGSDLSSLENTIKFNLQLPYDKPYVMSQMSDDFDPHLDIACEGGLVTQSEVDFFKIAKEGFPVEKYEMTEELKGYLALGEEETKGKIKEISKARSSGKATNYSCQYGAGGATVARAAGITLGVGKKLVEAYRDLNWSIDKIAQEQVRKRTSFGMYQLNPFNGIWYHLKTEKDAFSTLVQGTGSYVLDLWLVFIFKLRDDPKYDFGGEGVKLLATFHDELIVEILKGKTADCERLILDSLDKVNEVMKLEIPFGCDIQFGDNYAEIH